MVEYRGTATITRFSNVNRYAEGWQLVEDMTFFSAASLVDDAFDDLLKRQDVSFVIIEVERPLNLQLAYLRDWFTLLGEAGGYRIYGVKADRPASRVVAGNTALVKHDWKTAEGEYTAALAGSYSDRFLAHLGSLFGLSRVYGEMDDQDVAYSARSMEVNQYWWNNTLSYLRH